MTSDELPLAEAPLSNQGEAPTEGASSTDQRVERLRQANSATEAIYKQELSRLNHLNPGEETLPNWGMQVYNDLPDWGREPCAHGWLDGLEAFLQMIARESYWPAAPGRCGEMTPVIAGQVERLAAGTQRWLDGLSPLLEIDQWIPEALAEHTTEKDEAARCFVELLRAAFSLAKERWEPLAAGWRVKAASNPLLARLFAGGGLDEKLDCSCGFLLVKKLKLYLRVIAGEAVPEAELNGWCNMQLRDVWREDPERVLTTQGILWGLYASLKGLPVEELRERVPWCAGSAIYTLRLLSVEPSRPALRRWLVASMLVKTKRWYSRMLNFADDGVLPPALWDVPQDIAG